MPTKQTVLSNRRFGLEIEFTSPPGNSMDQWGQRLARAFGSTHTPFVNTHGYGHTSGIAWELKTDSSCGLELASPALDWNRWGEVELAMQVLRQHNAEITDRCSLHVHIEIRDLNRLAMTRLALLWGVLEPLAFECCAPHRRNNRFCRALKAQPWEVYESLCVNSLRMLARTVGRRTALNLDNWWRRGTAEFRLHHGTTDVAVARNWVLFVQTIVELAKRRLRRKTFARLATLKPVDVLSWLSTTFYQYYDHPAFGELVQDLYNRRKQWAETTITGDSVARQMARAIRQEHRERQRQRRAQNLVHDAFADIQWLPNEPF